MDVVVLGKLVAAVFVLSMLSLIFGENFFFKWGTRVVVGWAIVYSAILGLYWTDFYAIKPILEKADYKWLIVIFFGLLMYTRLSRRYAWISKYPISISMGIGFGMILPTWARAQILDQIRITIVELFSPVSTFDLIGRILVLVGLVTVITYFFFTKEHKGVLGSSAFIGRLFIMSSIAVIWAGDYLWAMSMLAGQLKFLINDVIIGIFLRR
ncbi:hypothetical protein FJY84_01370 [Candidatus Bathyarchaeota archaeon]|nr:hypothetical protein [Candidatus Bathyarchaeota archaeon]